MDWNIRIGKQGYVFILSDFKKGCFDVSTGLSNWKKVAGGNCKVAGVLSDRDTCSLVEWGQHPAPSAERNVELPLEKNQGALIKWSVIPVHFLHL